ncbi:MAG: type II secretion system protein [Verrucomicrobiales bacterium]
MTSRRRFFSRGFSLFEIVVAMAILGIIAGSVLSIIWQAADSAAEIRDLDRRDEEVGRFLALLRESIENLPPDGTLALEPPGESASGYHELKIGNSATAFTFGETVGSSEECVIALRPGGVSEEGETLFDIALSRDDFAPDDADGSGMVFRAGEGDLLQADEDGRYWLTLVSGVKTASWRYWESDREEWLEEWTDDEAMPELLEFSFADTYGAFPKRLVFQVPEQAVNPEGAVASAASTAPGQTAAVQTSEGRGGGEGRRPGRGGGRGRGDGAKGGDRPQGEGGRRSDGGGRSEGQPSQGQPSRGTGGGGNR